VSVVDSLIAAASEVLCQEETLVEVSPPPGACVTVVGDTHGQLHDVLRLFEVAGAPSSDSLFILNGDFVDRRVRAPTAYCSPSGAHFTKPTFCCALRMILCAQGRLGR
jgi:hypothetical protein